MHMLHDFCLTFPFSVLLATGGLMGYLMKGSMMSLVAGGGSGGVMFLLAMYNMGQFKKGRVAFEATWVNLVLSGGICHAMVQRWMETGAVFPSAVVAALAGGMAVFYALVLAFPPKVHAKKTE